MTAANKNTYLTPVTFSVGAEINLLFYTLKRNWTFFEPSLLFPSVNETLAKNQEPIKKN